MDEKQKLNAPLNTTPQQPQSPPAPPNYGAGYNQSDMLAIEKKKHRKKMFITLGSIFLAVVILAVLLLIIVNNTFGLKTISYDNGSGNAYQLSFYNKYIIRDSSSPSPADQADSFASKELVSQVSHGNKAPIVMSIEGDATEQQNQGSQEKNCTDSNIPEIFKVHNDTLDQDISVCRVGQNDGNDVLYVGVFEDGGQTHVFLIRQDIDISAIKDAAGAKDITEKVGLQAYTNDIKEILASVHLSK